MMQATTVESNLQPDRENSRSVVYFQTVHHAFGRATENARWPVERFYAIAGHPIRLRFAGPSLLPYVEPALAHLAMEHVSLTELTICLWDSESTGIPMPPPPWQANDHAGRGEIRGYNDERIRAVFQPDVGAVSMLDSTSSLAIYWVPQVHGIPYYESSAPLRTILHWWLGARGGQLAHAAAVGRPGGGVLIAGIGGSGKSTTALACLEAGFDYVGDDYVFLSHDPFPRACTLYNSAKLTFDHIQRFPSLLTAVSNPDKPNAEKAVIFLRDRYPERIISGLPIRAILLPHVTGLADTSLRKVSPATSLRALAPSTIFQLPGAGQGALQIIARFVQQVPSYVLELGTDIPRIPGVISGLLAELPKG